MNSEFTKGNPPSKSLHHALWIFDPDFFFEIFQLLSLSFSGILISRPGHFLKSSAAEQLFFRNLHPGTWTLFRNYLITHPETAKKYGELKIRLREKSGFDREAYTRGENGIRPDRGATGAGGRR